MSQGEWWYNVNGQAVGPVDFAALQQMVAERRVGAGDLVYAAALGEWRPAGAVPGLAAAPVAPPADPYGAGPHAPNPYGPQNPYASNAPPGGYPPYNLAYQPPRIGPSQQNMAIVGLVLAIFFWPAGLICSWVALNNMKKHGNPEGRGLAIAGIVVNLIFLVLSCIYLSVFVAIMGGYRG